MRVAGVGDDDVVGVVAVAAPVASVLVVVVVAGVDPDLHSRTPSCC